MSKIQVNVEDLKNFADIIGDIEDQCDDALRHLNWDFSSFLADLPGVSPKRVKEVEEIYRNVIKKYQAKLDHAQQLVKHTEAAMRQAEKNIGDKAGEFGLEMLGYYDVQRVFGEYDPITGEKVSGADRLLATGMLALSLYPPGKAVGVTGKVAIKGANAGTKTSTKFGLSSIAKSPKVFQSLKNVVSTGKVLEVFKGLYKQVVEAPLAATKLWMDRTVRQIADFLMPVNGPQLATAMGPMPRNTVVDAVGEAKDPFVKMVKGDGVKRAKGYPKKELDEVIASGYDEGGILKERWIVPKGYDSVEDFLKVVDDTTIKEFGYDNVEEFKEVIGHVDQYLNESPNNTILNKGLAGGKHVKGVDYDVLGFPIFKGEDLKYALKLEKDFYVVKDPIQFKECTKILKGAIEKGEIPKSSFTTEQLEQIAKGRGKIKGLTWHHHQVPGKMQLVLKDTHGAVNHLGGNKLWGEGIR